MKLRSLTRDQGSVLTPGVPSLQEYEACLRGSEFRAMESFSNEFIAANREALAPYRRLWVADPLHQWSRQWEYPFVLDALEHHAHEHAASGAPRKYEVLDAGSGVTFFPYWIADRITGASVTCCDHDGSLTDIYASLRDPAKDRVRFNAATLDRLPCGDSQLDALYSISVLEHTTNYGDILDEFSRVLRPGGLLAITFDISLDGRCQVNASEAATLLRNLAHRFEPIDAPPVERLDSVLAAAGMLTTEWALRTRPHLLPWRRSRRDALRSLARLQWPRAPFFSCTIYCGTYRRSEFISHPQPV